MQIFKKRMSVHRTSRNLRSLWDEYALQITAEGRERDASRLLALSSFMESIFDVGQPLEPTSLGNFDFDDTVVVITGLLNVARRASIQLLTDDSCKEGVDRATLAEALRKALTVARLCLKKCPNRENINEVPHIVSLVLSILENVANIDDKILSMQILGYILQFEESKLELQRLGGLQLLCSLGLTCLPDLRRQIVSTLRLYLAPSAGTSGVAIVTAAGRGSSSFSSLSSERKVHPPHSLPHSQSTATMESCHNYSSTDLLKACSDVQSQHESSLSGDSLMSAAWPPLPPRNKLSIFLAGHVERDSRDQSQDAPPPQSEELLPHETDPTAHPSASLAAKGVNMAVNAVHEILRLTPMATTNWLHNDILSHEEDPSQRAFLGLGGNSLVAPTATSAFANGSESAVCGGLDLTAPPCWRDYECRRLEFTGANMKHQLNGDSPTDDLSRPDNCATTRELVCLIVSFLKMSGGEVVENSDNVAVGAVSLEENLSLLHCVMKLLIHHESSRGYFLELNGYEVLITVVGFVIDQIGMNSFGTFLEQGTLTADDCLPDDDNFADEKNINITALLLSLVLGTRINVEDIETLGDVTYKEAVKLDLLVKNSHALGLIVRLAGSDNTRHMEVGICCMEMLLRLCPLAVIALENSSAIVVLGSILIERSMIAAMVMNASPPYNNITHCPAEEFRLCQSASNVLMKVAVLDAEVNVHVLAFFAFLLHENALLQYRTLSVQGAAAPIVVAAGHSLLPRCANCETEVAAFECTDRGCICDDMFYLCVECDKVFHKSVLKRNHIRLPVIELVSAGALLEAMGAALRSAVENQNNDTELKHAALSRDDILDDVLKEKRELLAHTSCLLLSHIASLVNDRQVKLQNNPEEVLDAVLRIFRYSILTASKPGPQPGHDLHMDVDVQHSGLKNAADCFLESKHSLGLLSKKPTSGTNTRCGHTFEPPEDVQYKAQRIFLSLCLQIMARYFVTETIPTHLTVYSEDLCDTSANENFFSVNNGRRSHLVSRIRSFRAYGIEALLSLAVVSNNSRLLLTEADKQFALWTLREVCVSAYSVEIDEGNSLMIWWGWLLHCPVLRESSSGAETSRKAKARDSKGSQNRQQAWKLTLAAAVQDYSLGIVLPPVEHMKVCSQIRVFILQEVRLLLGGEAWDPVLVASAAGIPSKLCKITCSPATPALSTRAGGDNDGLGESPSAFFRIPISKRMIQARMVNSGLLQGLIDVVCGDLCHPGILHGLHLRQPGGSAEIDCVTSIFDLDIEGWWCGINALHSLVTKCSLAKQVLDDYIGVMTCTKLLQPLIQVCCSRPESVYIGIALSNLIVELSVHSSLSSISRPFLNWSKSSTIHHHNPPQPRSFFDRLLSPFSTQCNANSTTLGDLSCVYFLKMSCCRQIAACLCPHAVFLHPSSYEQISEQSTPMSRSNSNCMESRSSFKIDIQVTPSTLGGERGVDFSDHYFDDRSSTGRGSFSLHSLSHQSLPVMPRVYSTNSMQHTPTASVAADTVNTFEEYGVGLGGAKVHMVNQTASNRGVGEELGDYSGTFLPMSSALGWGLGHRCNIILRIVYDTLLLRSDSMAAKGSGLDTNGVQSASLLRSLRMQSIEQYMQSFVSVGGESGCPWRDCSSASREVSISPTCVFRSLRLVVNLFSLCLVLRDDTGEVQASILRTLSHLINGNPLNSDIIHRSNLTLNLSRFAFSHDNTFPRNSICHILSQLFSFKVTPAVFNSLVETASSVSGVHMTERPMLLIPTKGVSQRIAVETDLDDVGCQILYLLGRALENTEAATYAHFDQACPFLSRVVLLPIHNLPPRQVGFSAFMWLRLGNLSDGPNATLLQLSMDHPMRHDLNSSTSEEDGDKEKEKESLMTAHSVDFYFRVVHQTGISQASGGSRFADSSFHPQDFASVASGTTGCAAVEEVQRSYVQLCVSYGESESMLTKKAKSRSSSQGLSKGSSSLDNTSGLDGEIVSSLVKYSAPDVIIDFEWHEMGDWHSLFVSVSSNGISCSIDGVAKRVLYWTALGYVDADDAPPNIRYPDLAANQVLQPVLGGIIHEQYAYMDSMQSLMDMAERCNVGLQVGGAEHEVRLQREVDLLQSYTELVRGMSGYVGSMLLLAGVPDEAAIMAAHSQGLQTGDMANLFAAQKTLCRFVSTRFGGGTSSKEALVLQGRSFKNNMKVSDHVDIDAASSSHLTNPEQQRYSRGRHGLSGEENVLRSSTRVSRSLSPNNSRHHHHITAALQSDINRASSERHIVQARDSRDHDQGPAQSIVSDILTMLAGSGSTRVRTGSKSDNEMYLEGSVLIRNACYVADEICSFARGGLRVWYPLLIMDGPRQVATLRIVASLITSSTAVYSEFEAIAMSSVILYSMYVTPLLASEASLQVLFDLATQSRWPRTVSISMPPSKHELIHRTEFLMLSVQIAAASPYNIQLSLCSVEWLLGICDDSLDNIAKVLDTTGIIPFLLMLSLWLKCEDIQLLDTEGGTIDGCEVTEYTIRMPCADLSTDEKVRILSSSKGVFYDSIYSDQPKKLAKLQVTIARFLKLLITGSNGELPSIRVAASTQSPTGFSVQHMQSLLNFIAFSMEASMSESADTSITGVEPRRRRSHGTNSDFVSASTAANWTSFFVPSTRTAPQTTSLRACQLALDCIIYPSEGPLGSTIITMLRNALPGNELWYMILNLLNCTDVAIKARALHLLGLSLSTLEGQIDQRLVAQLEKIGGFRSIAAAFSGFSGDSEAIMRELFSLFFWRSGSRGMFAYSKCVSPTESSLPSHTVTESVQDTQSGFIDQRINRDASTGTGSIFSMFNWMSKPDKADDVASSGKLRTAPIPVAYTKSKADSLAFDDDGSSGLATSNNSSNSSSSTHEHGDEDVTEFRSIIADKMTDDEVMPPVHEASLNPGGKDITPPRIETIVLPQILEAILKVMENEPYAERIIAAVASIEQALVFPSGLAAWDLDEADYNALQSTIAQNMEAVTGEKMPDWLLWVYNCLVVYKRRDVEEMLQDGNCLSLSEGESGMESGDESVDTERRPAGRSISSPSSPTSMHHTHSLLNRFADPLLGMVQIVLRIDMVKKPSSSRKLFDILKLPAPEAREQQLTILLDLLHSVNYHKQYNNDPHTCMNVLRNISAFLEKVLLKCEISLEFCVQAVHTLDSLVYRAPPDVRSKVKDTLLPEVRNAYVTYCLVQRAESGVWPRISALAEMHSSVLNLILSGEARSIYDHQVFLLLLELFLQATTLNIEDDESALDSSNCRSEEFNVNFEMQVAVVVLIQNCVLASADCRRCAEKVFSRLNEQAPELTDLSNVVMKAFLNTFVDSKRQRCTSTEIATDNGSLKTPPVAQLQQRSSWWGAFVGTNVTEQSTVQPDSQLITDDTQLHDDDIIDEECAESMSTVPSVNVHPDTCANEQEKFKATTLILPHDTSSFVEWFNANDQRLMVDTFNLMLPKLLEPVHRLGDKILEKYVQKQGQNNVKLQNKRQKDKTLLGRSIKELHQKTKVSDEKRRVKYQQELGQFTSKLKKQILMGSVDFKSYMEEYNGESVPINLQERTVVQKDDDCVLEHLSFKDIYEDLMLDI